MQGAGMETYLTIEEVAAYLKMAVQTIRRYVLNREIPFHKIKKVIRFRLSEIELWVEQGGASVLAREDDVQEGGLFDDVLPLDERTENELEESGDNCGGDTGGDV
jgi:excisionase family DNA binding protein